jgi:ornithine cyclodeaminase/alanine dehydrogenase-like protein (mu-crystallin family)
VTLLLSRTAVTQLLNLDAALELLAQGFRTAPDEPAPLRVRTDLPGPGTATCLMPGLLPGVPAYTVKVNAKFPAARPALRGVVCLHSLDTGELLALADSASITAWRTGLAAALASHVLAGPDARTAGFVGAGAQARLTVTGLRRLRTWDRIVATDLDPARAAALVSPAPATPAAAGPDLGEPGEAGGVLPDARAVAAAADVVILATWSREPLLDVADVRPGQHLTTLGADEPGKIELSGGLLAGSRVLTDDIGLAVRGGALGSAGLPAEAAAGTLGQVLRGEILARAGGQPTVYAPVGLPWQDLALAWPLYQAARAAGTGQDTDLLA